MGKFFQIFTNLKVFAMQTPKNLEKKAYILRKIPEMGLYFARNH